MGAGHVLAILLLSLWVNPLTPEERIVIDTARDDRGHADEAMAVLLTHAAGWSSAELGDEPIRLVPDIAAMLANPKAYRGDLCRIEGRLEQRTSLGDSFAGADEWFIRLVNGTPVVVYLPIDDGMKPLRDGDRVAIHARFCKRMTYEARDGEARQYAAFVGAKPWRIDAPNPWRGLWVIAALVMLLLVTFVVLFAIVKRGGAVRRARSLEGRRDRLEEADAESAAAPLPSDPADALAELSRRKGTRE